MERVGELVIETHIAARDVISAAQAETRAPDQAARRGLRESTELANMRLVDQQVKLRVALTGLEDELPKSREMAWAPGGSAAVVQLEDLWQHADEEVKQALRSLEKE